MMLRENILLSTHQVLYVAHGITKEIIESKSAAPPFRLLAQCWTLGITASDALPIISGLRSRKSEWRMQTMMMMKSRCCTLEKLISLISSVCVHHASRPLDRTIGAYMF